MKWFLHFLWSPIGKKLLMAGTGLCFCGFLLLHLAGNLNIYRSPQVFVAYAAKLQELGPLLTAVEFLLLFLALVHVLTGLTLFYENVAARPRRYAVKKNAGGRSIGSATMPYTGLLILIFVVVHLLNFYFVGKTDRTIFQIVAATFSHPGYVIVYIAAMLVAAVHVSHGLWSAFQSIGANHPKYMPGIRVLSILFSLLIAVGLGTIPIFVAMVY